MPAFEWVHVQLHQQKGMISLSPPTICNSAPAATTKSAGAKRRCPAECRQSFAGTVKAARPGRSQQALPLTLTSDIRH
ncbi:hypothetical protein [Klebsiella pneumoniae]|uniref:hypothetical protein n=1 Tax=Klebsiella pneumoniae TaxID=573 RepID=UPI003F78BDDC